MNLQSTYDSSKIDILYNIDMISQISESSKQKLDEVIEQQCESISSKLIDDQLTIEEISMIESIIINHISQKFIKKKQSIASEKEIRIQKQFIELRKDIFGLVGKVERVQEQVKRTVKQQIRSAVQILSQSIGNQSNNIKEFNEEQNQKGQYFYLDEKSVLDLGLQSKHNNDSKVADIKSKKQARKRRKNRLKPIAQSSNLLQLPHIPQPPYKQELQ